MTDTFVTVGQSRRGAAGLRRVAPRARGGRRQALQISPYRRAKRAFDVIAAALLLALLLPAMAIIWLVVRATSKGPGLHWSERVGRDGVLFEMPKFRTMYADAPLAPREALANANDRITPFGRVLRRFSIDELPQLACVLVGQMSFVGPRPLLAIDPGTEARRSFPVVFSARPGLSGIAQVSGRNKLSSRRKARLDAFYARSGTAGMDVRILLSTVVVVMSGRGFV